MLKCDLGFTTTAVHERAIKRDGFGVNAFGDCYSWCPRRNCLVGWTFHEDELPNVLADYGAHRSEHERDDAIRAMIYGEQSDPSL